MLTLSTLTPPDFLTATWGRTFAHMPGNRGRFHELLAWSDVNGMLQRHRLEPPRLRLVRKGAFASKDQFLRYDGPKVPFVVPEKLSQLLRDGFEVKLPRAVFRPVDLPGSVGGVVSLAGRTVELTLATEAVEMTPEAIWYSASVRSRTTPAVAPAP